MSHYQQSNSSMEWRQWRWRHSWKQVNTIPCLTSELQPQPVFGTIISARQSASSTDTYAINININTVWRYFVIMALRFYLLRRRKGSMMLHTIPLHYLVRMDMENFRPPKFSSLPLGIKIDNTLTASGNIVLALVCTPGKGSKCESGKFSRQKYGRCTLSISTWMESSRVNHLPDDYDVL